jgi:hypothetical protein
MKIVGPREPRGGTPDSASGNTSLKVTRCRRILTLPGFGSELAHLLRRPMSSRTQYLDAGIMCRENALLIASIAARCGLSSQICTGRIDLCGPLQSGLFGVMEFETHAWVDVDGIGICDFSPDLADGAGLGWVQWPVRYLIGTRYFPRQESPIGNYFLDEAQFHAHRENLKQRSSGYATAYLETERVPFDAALAAGAVDFARSYLIQDLGRQPFFSPNILGKAAVHVWKMAKGRAASTTDRSQLEAWRTVASIPDAAAGRFWARSVFKA